MIASIMLDVEKLISNINSSFIIFFKKPRILIWNIEKNDRKNENDDDLDFTRYLPETPLC
jgi:hypothetical protein